MREPPHYTGFIARTEAGRYEGELVDDTGFKIVIRGEVEEHNGTRRFRLEGDRCAPPDWMRVPLLDDGGAA